MIGPQLPHSLKRKRDADTDDDQQASLKRVKLNNESIDENKTNEDKTDLESKETQKLMHPRNIYRFNKPNYEKLACKYAFFKDVVKQNSKTGEYYINYNDSKSNVMLSKVLLKHDFNLEFEHPLNHLCPPIPQRLNYMLWIQDLLQCCCWNKRYHGFDIGVGASCIFPLLGIKIGETQNELWSFLASDIDKESIDYANKNVSMNKLNDKIKIVHQSNANYIFNDIINDKNNDNVLFDFTVCNPPFFQHLQETGLNKTRANNATQSELVFQNGGEIGFIQLIINQIEQLKLYRKINWFTTMLGRKSSIKSITNILKKQATNNNMDIFITNTALYQGKQVRWGLAWTYKMEIKHKYNLIYQPSSSSSSSDNNNKNEFLFYIRTPPNCMNYTQCLLDKLQILFTKYGLKYGPSLEHKNQWIEIDDLNNNGFTFRMKWIIKPINNLKISVILSIKYHKGDKSLYSAFVDWLYRRL